MTAEVLFSRPDDPLLHIKRIVDSKLVKRGATGYNPTDNDAYLRECYEDPSVRTAGSGGGTIGGDVADEVLSTRLAVLEKLIKASRSIAQTLDPFEATSNIIAETCDILECDRATLFKLDESRNELQLMVAEGAKSIFLPVGKGIAGTVAADGETINIPDAYSDSRFDSSHDKATGYKTSTILAAPVKDARDATVGVIQAINTRHGAFTDIDEEILSILAAQAGIALRNAELFHTTRASQERVRSMLEIIKAMHGDLGINSLMFTITQRAHTLVDADRCTFFLANHVAGELWAMQGEVDIRIPIDKGIAGAVATSGETVNIPDAYSDDRFNKEVDMRSGYRTKTILCMPLKTRDGTVVGVIQLINKASGVFDAEDEDLMGSFLAIAAPIIQNSQLWQSRNKKKEDEGTEFSGKLIRAGSARDAMPAAPIIEEGDEEEGEDED
jgi:adenylate cyclase